MVYVIQCDPDVPPGLAADELDLLSPGWELVRLDKGDPLPADRKADALIVLGGAMSVHDEELFPFLKGLKRHIRERVHRGSRFLGICLGGQLLASALGASVIGKRWGELGCRTVSFTDEGRSDMLFKDIGSPLKTFQWHNDSFDLPEGAVLLASSAACPHQAFRVGGNAWGVQFHPEVTPAIITAWSFGEGRSEAEARGLVCEWERDEKQHRQVISCLMRNFAGG